MKKFVFLVLIVSLAVFSCKTGKYADTNRVYKKQARTLSKQLREYPVRDSAGLNYADWVGTTNLSLRKPNFVVIHHTAQNSCDHTLRTFTQTRNPVSSHYVICRDGTVHHMLNDLLRAHHAGVSKWGNNSDLNSSSIGIEIDNNGSEPFTEPQLVSLLTLLDRLKKAYAIPTGNFIGHADIAPGRKVDPSRYFPWQRLAQQGFGHWYDTTAVTVPDNFDPLLALRIIGYTLSNEKNAIQSYKIHFVPQDTTRTFTEADRKILADLVRKYQ